MDKIIFPVMTIFGKSNTEFCRTEEELTTCNRLGFKNGYYNNLRIIDSHGKVYKIISAEKIGYAGPLWGFNLKYGQQLRVRLNFSKKIDKINLEEFKKKMFNIFKNDIHFWDSGGNLEDIKEMVQKAKSIEAIIKHLTKEFYKNYIS